jgi:diguanylate cyclase (GGDEF)-like protein/PAS domain S-box-containing protein
MFRGQASKVRKTAPKKHVRVELDDRRNHFGNPDIALEHFRAIVQSSDDAIISKTLDGVITSWNEGATRIFGYAEDEILGRPMLALFPPDKIDEESFILDKIRAGETVDHYQTVRVRKDGRNIDVSVTISPIRDFNGTVIGASKIARDITAQKNAEARLQLTANVFTHTSDGIVITDVEGTILEVNEAFSRITGFSRAEVVGRSSRMFASSRQGPELQVEIGKVLTMCGHWQGEVWSRRKDGESYAGLLTVNAVRNSDGTTHSYVALFADITPLRRNQEKLEHLAHFDSLTDLPNRLLLSDRLNQAMLTCRRNGRSLAVLYLDLDGFKAINDRYGHDAGDNLLVAVSARMKGALRAIDTLARIGGDEFVAVLADVASHQDCIVLVERILHACAEPVFLEGDALRVSASIGVAIYPQDEADAEQLIRHADRAMYEAKQAGKNRYHLFDPAQHEMARSRGENLEEIVSALKMGQFALHYQPKVNMRTGEVVGVEALIRWNHPVRGLLVPHAFLPLVEGHALSESLDEWVIGTALAQIAEWQRCGVTMSVSVNVGARHLQEGGFANTLARLLAAHPEVDPHRLELEILETSAMDDIKEVSVVMAECHRLGVRFAVDDFGTGYSSLVYLKRLPAETLKIDRSFVRDMLVDREDLAIVQGIIGLAGAFNRSVIAEGVESFAHGERLLELGCDLAQGYVISRPMPAGRLLDWIAGWRSPVVWSGVKTAD